MIKDIVIARYKEVDLSWTLDLLNTHQIYLYSKSSEPFNPVNSIGAWFEIENNGGNEAATYLYHIIENYNQLADITIFCQAWPFDHDRHFLSNINAEIDDFRWLSHEMLRNEWDGSPHHGKDMFIEGKVEGLHPDWLYSAIMGNRPPDYFYFGQGGQHMVTRDVIQRKPVEFYKRALYLITGSFKSYKPFCAMERFWDKFYLDPHYCLHY